ncbi:MAG: hypothetical protein RLN81_03510 [Balneolaceae bacterium]
MGKSFKFFNSKINYDLLVRFLRGKVGSDWNEVIKEIEERIPTNLLEYKDCVKWFVSDLIEKREDGLWDKREQKYLRLEPNRPFDWNIYISKEFYVDPETNILIRVMDFPSNRKTKGMNSEQLRKFRENQKRSNLEKKRTIKAEKEESKNRINELIRKPNKQE